VSQAVILAGGKGTRLSSVSGGLPKPLVPLDGVPVIERQIRLLCRYGVEELFLTTYNKADQIQEALGDGSRYGVRLNYVLEERPLGTAGGVGALRGRLTEDFFVVYGDVLVHMDLARLLRFHDRAGADATIVAHPNDHPYDSDLIDIDHDGRVRAFHPAPRPETGEDLANMVSAALYVLSPEALEYIEQGVKQDFVRHVFPRMLAGGARLFGYHTTEYLKDMGTPDRLQRVEQDLRSGLVESMHADNLRPALFLDRDGVINEEIDGVLVPDQLLLLPGVGPAIRRLNRSGWLAAIVTNQPFVAKGFMAESDVDAVHRRLEARLGAQRAWIDGLAYCPHHPHKGFDGERPELKIDCACRKPGKELFHRIESLLPVDKARSAMVGDSWRDMSAAHAYGIDAICVRTGRGNEPAAPAEQAVSGRPDVVVDDLTQAVALLLDPDDAVQELTAHSIDMSRAMTTGRLAVLIGGLSRSGKSLVAFRLRRELAQRGYRALWVRLDDWLLPASERSEDSTVQQRFRVAQAQTALNELLSGKQIKVSGYEPRTREALPQPVAYDPAESQIIIVDGVPALLLELSGAERIRVQVNAPDEHIRLERLRHFYRYKGMTDMQCEELIAARAEEHASITQAGLSADMTIVPRDLYHPPEDGANE
jgi:histidinol-phosphate phosphatase family protein